MTRETVIQIAKYYIRHELKLHPTASAITMYSDDDGKSKIVEFQTQEGCTVEVRIRPRVQNIISKTVSADNHATFHSAKYEILSVDEVFRNPHAN